MFQVDIVVIYTNNADDIDLASVTIMARKATGAEDEVSWERTPEVKYWEDLVSFLNTKKNYVVSTRFCFMEDVGVLGNVCSDGSGSYSWLAKSRIQKMLHEKNQWKRMFWHR